MSVDTGTPTSAVPGGLPGGTIPVATPTFSGAPVPGASGGTPDPSAQVSEMTKKLLQALAQASQRKQFAGQPQPAAVPGMRDPNAARQIGMNTANPHAWGTQRFMAGLATSIQNAVAKQKQQKLLKAESDWTYLQSGLNELYQAQASNDPKAAAAAQAKVDVVMGDPKKLKDMAKALNQDWLNPEKTTVYGEALKKVNAQTQQTDAQKQQAAQGIKGVFQKLMQRQQKPQLSPEQQQAMGREIQSKAPTTTPGLDPKSMEVQEKILHDRAEEARQAKQEDVAAGFKKAELAIQEARLAQEKDNQKAELEFKKTEQATRDRAEKEKERHDKAEEGISRSKGPTGAGTGLTGASSRDMSLVKGIYNYDLDPAKVTSLRGNERERIMGMVEEYAAQQGVPYDATAYVGKQGTVKSFDSGEASQAIRSLNQAVGHLESLREAGEKLDNSKIPWYNKAKNWISQSSGNPQVTNFNTRLNAVVDEMTRVFRNSGGTEEDIKQWRSTINAAESPAQLKGAIDSMLDLMSSRLNALSEQYKKGTRGPKDFDILTDKSREILGKIGGSASKMVEADKSSTAAGQAAGMETQTYNGATYQRKKGSNDEWTIAPKTK